jgi:ABC-type (unclassified) transport system, ATPase component
MKSILEFDSIFLEFDLNRVLSSVAMKCQVGEVVGLLGRNGSGKSCLMRVVFGSMASEFKSVRINGQPLTGNYLRERLISYLPQQSLIPSYLTVRAALKFFEVNEARILEVFPHFENTFHQKPSQFSGGSLRLIETLMILFSKGKFCILDEPFSGIMPLHIEEIKKVIQQEKHKKGIIITDHLYRHVTDLTDRLYVLVNGQTYLLESADELADFGYLHQKNENTYLLVCHIIISDFLL